MTSRSRLMYEELMFIALYKMTAKPGQEKEFENAWAEVTEAIFARRGSLGSRLHVTEQERVYVAYAQWPSRERYFAKEVEIPEPERAARSRMKDAMESVEILHTMTVTDDRLR